MPALPHTQVLLLPLHSMQACQTRSAPLLAWHACARGIFTYKLYYVLHNALGQERICSIPTRLLAACRPSAEKYAADQDTFFNDYSKAHLKLSEVGSEWVEGSPVRVDY